MAWIMKVDPKQIIQLVVTKVDRGAGDGGDRGAELLRDYESVRVGGCVMIAKIEPFAKADVEHWRPPVRTG